MTQPVTVESLMFSASTVQWIVMAAIGIYAWIVGRQSASNKEVLDLRLRLAEFETVLKNLPTHQDLSELEARLERMIATQEGIFRELKPITQQLNRINDYLLNHKE